METTPHTPPEPLRAERRFGEVVNAAVSVLAERAGTFFPALLAVVFVPLMLTALGEVQGDAPEGLGVLLSFVGSIASAILGVLVVGCTYAYAFLYESGEEVTAGSLWRGAAELFWPIFGVQWTLGVLVMLAAFGLILPAVVLQSAVLGGVGGLLVLGLLLYTFPVLVLATPVRIMEADGALDAIGRSFRLVRGHWGQTFGVGFVTNLIAGAVFLLPYITIAWTFGVFEGGGTGSVLVLALLMIAMAGYLAFALPSIAMLLQYFNLVEQKQAPGLSEEIELIGDREEDDRPLF